MRPLKIARKFNSPKKMAHNVKLLLNMMPADYCPDKCLIPYNTVLLGHMYRHGVNGDKRTVGEYILDNDVELAMPFLFSSWIFTQAIYRFDKTVYKEVIKSEFKGKVPFEVLYKLPHWSLYIETPDLFLDHSTVYGFWVGLSGEMPDDLPESLIFLMDTDKGLVVNMIGKSDITLNQLFDGFQVELIRRGLKSSTNIKEITKKLLALTLYVCSENPDIKHNDVTVNASKGTDPRQLGRLKLQLPKKERLYDVGKVLGESIRSYSNERKNNGGANSTKTPHIRKAHWHGYWTGKQSGERHYILKWLAPIPVNSREIL